MRFPLQGLWRHADFRRYWAANTVSAFGTAVTRLALPLVATVTLDASPAAIGLIAFAEEAPLLLFGLVAGVWLDRRRRLPVMLATDLARAALLLAVPLAWWRDWLSVPLLVAVAFGVGTLSVFAEVAAQSLVSTLLPPRDFLEGNSKRYAGESAAQAAGPALGGGLAQLAGPAPAVLFDAVSYLASFALLRRIGFQEPEPTVDRGEPVLRALAAGLREIGANPTIRLLTVASAFLTFLANMGFAMLVPFSARTLDLPAATIGTVLSVGGLASLAGVAVVGTVGARLGVGRSLAAGLGGTIPPLLVIALAGGGTKVAAAMLVAGMAALSLVSPLFDITQFSLRQAVIPDALRGRVVAGTRVAIRGCAALGALSGGIVADVAGLRAAMLVAALAPVPGLILLLRSPVLSLRAMPEPADVSPSPAPGPAERDAPAVDSRRSVP